MREKNKFLCDKYGDISWVKVIILVIVAIFLLITIVSSFKIVPTGYAGVRTTFGQISEKPVGQGINFKIPYVQSIKTVSCKLQDTKVDSEVWGETTDKTPVHAKDITVSYKISASKVSWLYRNVNNIKDLISSEIISSTIKSAMIELDVTTVTNRAHIEPLVKEKLNASLAEKYGEGTLSVEKVVINNMDFEDAYNEAIQKKSIALQQKEEQAIKNETAIAKAEADKKVAIANAEAKAEAKRIAAEAEATANKKVSDSLTDKVLENKFYDKWNGELPQVMGDGSAILDVRGTTK